MVHGIGEYRLSKWLVMVSRKKWNGYVRLSPFHHLSLLHRNFLSQILPKEMFS